MILYLNRYICRFLQWSNFRFRYWWGLICRVNIQHTTILHSRPRVLLHFPPNGLLNAVPNLAKPCRTPTAKELQSLLPRETRPTAPLRQRPFPRWRFGGKRPSNVAVAQIQKFVDAVATAVAARGIVSRG